MRAVTPEPFRVGNMSEVAGRKVNLAGSKDVQLQYEFICIT